MSKRIKTIAFFCGVYVLSFCGAALLIGEGGDSETEAVEAVSNVDTAINYHDETVPAVKYILREYEGNICVYYMDNNGIPAIITDIPVEGLRSVDREMIERGIEVSTKEEVLKLLEDFGS